MKRLPLILLIVFIVLCAVGGLMLKGAAPAKKPNGASEATVSRGEVVDEIVETGSIAAVDTVAVKSQVSGRLQTIYVQAGDMVKKGQLVAVIDPLETQLSADQNRAQLSGAKAGVDKQRLTLDQRRIQVQAAYDQAQEKLKELQAAADAQPALTQAAIREAQASYQSALEELNRLQNVALPNERVSTKATLDEAKANYEQAQSEYQRQMDLLGKGYTAQRTMESARQSVQVAEARLRSAQDSMNRLDSSQRVAIQKQRQAVMQARASLDSARANSVQDFTKRQDYLSAIQDLEKAKADLKDVSIYGKELDSQKATVDRLSSVYQDSLRLLRETQIRAPMDGIVSKKLMNVGELVAALNSFSSGSEIIDIEDRRRMKVTMDVNEIDAAKMKIGMPSKITVDALPNKAFTGVVTKIAPSSNSTSSAGSSGTSSNSSDVVVKYQVEVYLDHPDSDLRSGMSAKCAMEAARRENVLKVPVEFIGQDGNEHFALRITGMSKDKKTPTTERVKVTVGAASGTEIEVVSGLKEGDKLSLPDFNGPKRKGAIQVSDD